MTNSSNDNPNASDDPKVSELLGDLDNQEQHSRRIRTVLWVFAILALLLPPLFYLLNIRDKERAEEKERLATEQLKVEKDTSAKIRHELDTTFTKLEVRRVQLELVSEMLNDGEGDVPIDSLLAEIAAMKAQLPCPPPVECPDAPAPMNPVHTDPDTYPCECDVKWNLMGLQEDLEQLKAQYDQNLGVYAEVNADLTLQNVLYQEQIDSLEALVKSGQ